MPDNDLKSILGEPENQKTDLTSVLGEPELKKKDSTSPTSRDTSPSESKSDSVTPLANLNNFYPPTDSETPSIKNKQQDIIKERTKQRFLNDPLFQETNPNAEKNKQIWIDKLAKEGYDRGELELVKKATTKAKQVIPEKGFWDKTEGEISRDFWNKTTDAALEGYNQIKQAFSEPLKTEEGKPIDANTPITKIDIAKPITKAIVGGTTALFSPVIGAFGEVTDAIKSAADKTLPEPAAKVVGEALPTIFSLAHKTADALGYNPKEDSAGQHLLSIADMIIGGKVLHTPIKGYERIKSMEDLKEISQKAAKGELNPEELKSYENVVNEIKNTSLSDVKKAAEESNTPQGDVIASKISDIEKPAAEHVISKEVEDLHKQKSELEADKANLESQQPGAGAILDSKIQETDAKIEEVHHNVANETEGKSLNDVLHNEIDNRIKGYEDLKQYAKSENGIAEIDKLINEEKAKKAKLIPQEETLLPTPKEEIKLIHHGDDIRDRAKEVGGTEPTDITDKGERDLEKTAENLKGVEKIYSSPIDRAVKSSDVIKNKTGIPIETTNGLGAWKIGDFDGMKRDKFEKAQKWFVEHPNEIKLPEKGSRESIDADLEDVDRHDLKEPFGQFKDRVVKTYNDIVSKGEKNIGILTHSKNMKVIEALRKYGEWNEAAKKEFTDPENKIHSAEVITIKSKENAIQEQSPSGILQHPQEGIGETGSERGTLEQGVKRSEVTETGKEKENVINHFKRLEEIASYFKEGEVTKELRVERKRIFEDNPRVKEVNDKFNDIIKQLEAEGKLTKICP